MPQLPAVSVIADGVSSASAGNGIASAGMAPARPNSAKADANRVFRMKVVSPYCPAKANYIAAQFERALNEIAGSAPCRTERMGATRSDAILGWRGGERARLNDSPGGAVLTDERDDARALQRDRSSNCAIAAK
jgi:hypothetical protein